MSTSLIFPCMISGLLLLGCLNAVSCWNSKGSRRHFTPEAPHAHRSDVLAYQTHSDQTISGVLDLHWQEYFRLNPDLQAQGLSSPEDAWTHYR